MNVTVAGFETVMVRRYGPMMIACDMSISPATDASPRAYLADSAARALRALNQIGDPISPTDADFAGIAATDYDALFDAGGMFLLEAIIGNFVQVDYTEQAKGRKLAQFRDDAMKSLDWKRRQVRADHSQIKLGDMKGA